MFFTYKLRNFNIRLLCYVVVLNIIGILVIGSASNGDPAYMRKQILGAILGVFVAVVLGFMDYHQLLKTYGVVYIGSVVLLTAVLLVGDSGGGARRWVELPMIGRFQPSEFAKIGMVLFFAWFFDKNQEKINRPAVVANGCGTVCNVTGFDPCRTGFIYQCNLCIYFCLHDLYSRDQLPMDFWNDWSDDPSCHGIFYNLLQYEYGTFFERISGKPDFGMDWKWKRNSLRMQTVSSKIRSWQLVQEC